MKAADKSPGAACHRACGGGIGWRPASGARASTAWSSDRWTPGVGSATVGKMSGPRRPPSCPPITRDYDRFPPFVIGRTIAGSGQAAIAPVADVARMLHSFAMTKVGYDALMDEVCPTWGFCGCIKQDQPLHVSLLIPPDGPVSADQFVEWVFLADNLNPNGDPGRWQPQKEAIRAAFIQHMGGETVDARLLRWSHERPDEGERDLKFRGEIPPTS